LRFADCACAFSRFYFQNRLLRKPPQETAAKRQNLGTLTKIVNRRIQTLAFEKETDGLPANRRVIVFLDQQNMQFSGRTAHQMVVQRRPNLGTWKPATTAPRIAVITASQPLWFLSRSRLPIGPASSVVFFDQRQPGVRAGRMTHHPLWLEVRARHSCISIGSQLALRCALASQRNRIAQHGCHFL
jgi:hypothetical protein